VARNVGPDGQSVMHGADAGVEHRVGAGAVSSSAAGQQAAHAEELQAKARLRSCARVRSGSRASAIPRASSAAPIGSRSTSRTSCTRRRTSPTMRATRLNTPMPTAWRRQGGGQMSGNAALRENSPVDATRSRAAPTSPRRAFEIRRSLHEPRRARGRREGARGGGEGRRRRHRLGAQPARTRRQRQAVVVRLTPRPRSSCPAK